MSGTAAVGCEMVEDGGGIGLSCTAVITKCPSRDASYRVGQACRVALSVSRLCLAGVCPISFSVAGYS